MRKKKTPPDQLDREIQQALTGGLSQAEFNGLKMSIEDYMEAAGFHVGGMIRTYGDRPDRRLTFRRGQQVVVIKLEEFGMV